VPRLIIDTESSRPAYVRRRITTFVVTAVVVLAILAAGWFWMRNHWAAPAGVRPIPGNSAH
jgi:hypothetical protein